jgi:integrase
MPKILTQRAVDSARPRAKRYGLRDGLIPGHFLLVHPTGHKSYALFARINGEQAKLNNGNARIVGLGQARDQARRLLALIAQGQDPRAVKREALQPAPETLTVVAARFIERHARPRTKNWRTTERIFAREILPRWGNRPLAAVTRPDVIALLDSITDRDVPIMANRTLAAVRKFFGWCVERGLIEHAPTERLRAPSPEFARDRVHSNDELALIYRAALTLGYPFGDVIRLLILTGARRSEVAGMRWSEFDDTLTMWTLPKERVKNRTAHVVPLPIAAREILQSVPRFNSDYVFTTTGAGPVSGFSAVKRRLDAMLPAAIPPWRLHDFRRTVASGMAALGINLPTIEKCLNHISGSFAGIVSVYQRHSFIDEKAAALQAWANHVTALVGRPQRQQPQAQQHSHPAAPA